MSATLTQVEVPDIGDFDDVPVIEILVAVGDQVAAEDPLVTLESDKATMDVPAPFAGVVREITVALGDRVAQGSPLMSIEAEAGGSDGDSDPADADANANANADAGAGAGGGPAEQPAAAAPSAEPAVVPAKARQAPPEPAPTAAPPPPPGNGIGPIYASPSARRLAREHGVDLRNVSGSGRKGRITRDDVQNLADGRQVAPAGEATPAGGSTRDGAARPAGAGSVGLDLLPWPSVDYEKYGPVERVARTRIQRISAPNLARNWVMIPHVTHNDEADITELEAWRKSLNNEYARAGIKFTMVAFLVSACVVALKEFPDFNSSLDGDELVVKRYYNIGFAADTPGGLVVPVIKGADAKGLKQIASELAELSGKARDGKLSPGDMSGSTFTISSLGGIGGTSFTPIVNAPEVAILGVTRAATKPIWNGSAFEPRLMVPLSLSYDHRVIDGAAAARFVAYLVNVLSDLRRALL
jgi:pyruvate dehydrogenase E2 component (dihydrolipoamide acetyltransferase)